MLNRAKINTYLCTFHFQFENLLQSDPCINYKFIYKSKEKGSSGNIKGMISLIQSINSFSNKKQTTKVKTCIGFYNYYSIKCYGCCHIIHIPKTILDIIH